MNVEYTSVFKAVRPLWALVGDDVPASARAAKRAAALGGDAYERALWTLLRALGANASRVVDAAAVGELPSDPLERMAVVLKTTADGRRFSQAVNAVCDEIRRVTGRPRRLNAPQAIEAAR